MMLPDNLALFGGPMTHPIEHLWEAHCPAWITESVYKPHTSMCVHLWILWNMNLTISGADTYCTSALFAFLVLCDTHFRAGSSLCC
jgi:hypothetical protein